MPIGRTADSSVSSSRTARVMSRFVDAVVIRTLDHDLVTELAQNATIPVINALTKQWLKMSQNAAHGDSGACYGDSGGPTFLGAAPNDGDTVLAVTTTGDSPCYSTNVSARTDSRSARAFLRTFGL